MRKTISVALAAIIAISLAPTQAFALLLDPFQWSSQTGLSKPSLPPHADSPPALPGADSMRMSALGEEDAAQSGQVFDPGPLAASTDPAHAIEVASAVGSDQIATRPGDGANRIAFTSFEDGDIVVVLDASSPTGHAGLFDHRYYAGLSSYAVWSANTRPVWGVQREQCAKYRLYDVAYGLDVPSKRAYRFRARDFAARQIGKPYSVFRSKTDTRSFYCSKLAWAAWYYAARIDLDHDGGIYVWPVDLVLSRHTRLFGLWN
jgi:cell wall-associated NlpC family hydrolase